MTEKDEIIKNTLQALMDSREELKQRWLRNAKFYIGAQDLEWRASLFGKVAPRWLQRLVPVGWLGKWREGKF